MEFNASDTISKVNQRCARGFLYYSAGFFRHFDGPDACGDLNRFIGCGPQRVEEAVFANVGCEQLLDISCDRTVLLLHTRHGGFDSGSIP